MDLLAQLINIFFTVMWLAILARVLLSWIPNLPRNALVTFVYDITEPILGPLRRLIPPMGGMIDLSPMAAMLLLWLVQELVMRNLPR